MVIEKPAAVRANNLAPYTDKSARVILRQLLLTGTRKRVAMPGASLHAEELDIQRQAGREARYMRALSSLKSNTRTGR